MKKKECEICGKKTSNLKPLRNTNINVYYSETCEDCRNEYGDCFVVMVEKDERS